MDDDPGTAAAPARMGSSADGTAAAAEAAAATAVVPYNALREVTLLGGPGGSAAATVQVSSHCPLFYMHVGSTR